MSGRGTVRTLALTSCTQTSPGIITDMSLEISDSKCFQTRPLLLCLPSNLLHLCVPPPGADVHPKTIESCSGPCLAQPGGLGAEPAARLLARSCQKLLSLRQALPARLLSGCLGEEQQDKPSRGGKPLIWCKREAAVARLLFPIRPLPSSKGQTVGGNALPSISRVARNPSN